VYTIIKGTRRHRYISFRVTTLGNSQPLTDTELIQALRQQINELLSKTAKELGLWVVKFNGTTGIIRCNHKEKDHMIQLLQSLKKIGLKSVTVTTYATSGTIHGLIHRN
jgi:RNase P/RNase MRP subunit POP5